MDGSHQQIIIIGKNLAGSVAPVVKLGSEELGVLSFAEGSFAAGCSTSGCPLGDFLLTVVSGKGQKPQASYPLTIVANTLAAEGAQGPQGIPGPQGLTGPQGVKGEQGVPGPAGSFAAPSGLNTVFGTGPLTHFETADYVLEALSATSLQVRSKSASFLTASITHPSSCAASGGINSAETAQSFRFMSGVGQTLQGSLCGEGSTAFITIAKFLEYPAWFRCWRVTGNHNACQRVLPAN